MPLSPNANDILNPKQGDTSNEQALQRLSRALQFPTISHHKDSDNNATVWAEFVHFLEESFPLFHSKLKREKIEGACEHTRVWKWEGSDSSLKPCLLLAHMDVVPVEPGTEKDWTYPPFGGVQAEGFVWGRGALDMKSGVLSIMEAVEKLLTKGIKPKRTCYFSFGHDEEVGGLTGNALVRDHFEANDIRFEFVLDEGGAVAAPGMVEGMPYPAALIGIAEKGMMSLEFTVETIGGHASTPARETPIGILSSALSKLEQNPMPTAIGGVFKQSLEYLAPEMGFFNRMVIGNLWFFGMILKPIIFDKSATTAASMRTTIALTMFNAGTKENVLPKQARAIANIRILPGDSVRSVIKYVQDTINDKRVKVAIYKNISFEASEISSTSSPGWRIVTSTISQIFPRTMGAPYLTMQATDSRYFHSLSDSVYRFMPFHIDPKDLQRIHGTDERIRVDDYKSMIAFMTQLILNAQDKHVAAAHSHDEL